MFDVGFWELALCFVIALLVLGPQRLPGLARTLGNWVGRARRFVRQMSEEWEQEVDVTHWREEARRLREEMQQIKNHAMDVTRADESKPESGDSDPSSTTDSRTTSDTPGEHEREQ